MLSECTCFEVRGCGVQMSIFNYPSRETASGIITVDLGALVHNYRALHARLHGSVAGAVVKADAYGLGAGRVSPALYSAGCRHFFVALLDEALSLRHILPSDVSIYVLNGLLPGSERICAEAGVVPVLNSLEQLRNWKMTAGKCDRILPAVLQFDTGMSRLGLSPTDVETLIADPGFLDGLCVDFLMSHLACADEPVDPQNAEQLSALRRIAARFPGAQLCIANSAGILLGAEYHGSLVRPGFALYGGNPMTREQNTMLPVVRLDVRVIQTRTVPPGTRVGYGGAYVTSELMQLATIFGGYADGIPRHLSGKGAVYADGRRLPILGRVSMDTMTVNASALQPGSLHLGELVEVIGPHQSVEDIAEAADTIGYEILTRLGRRFHREYVWCGQPDRCEKGKE